MKKHRYSWKSFNTLEDFQKFIDVGNYRTRSDLEKVAPSFFSALLKRGFTSSDIHFPTNGHLKSSHKYDNFITIQDFQAFIDNNKVSSLKDFTKRYSGLLFEFRKRKFSTKDLIFQEGPGKKDYSKFNTIEDIQKLINSDFDINTSTDFIEKYGGLYSRMKIIGLNIKDLVFKEVKRQDLSNYKTLEDLKGYIKEKGIIESKDLVENHSSIYSKLLKLGYNISDLPIINSKTKEKTTGKWYKYKTKEDLQKYIDESGCKSLSTLTNKNGFMSKARRLGISLSEFVFPDKNKSSLEIEIEDFLKMNNINYITQKVFKDYNNFRFDFYLPEYELILEPGGDQHLIPIDVWGGENEFIKTRQRDLKKKEFCDSTGKTILYFFRFSDKNVYKVLEENGFLGSKYFIDLDEYFEEILRLINDSNNKKKEVV